METLSPTIASDAPGERDIRARLRAALERMYGDRLAMALLFGSRARGDAHAESDYDVAVFLTSMPDRWAEFDKLADLRVRFIDETGIFLDAKPFAAASYHDRTPLLHEIRRDGRDL